MKSEVLSSLLKNRWMEFSPSVLYERLARWILSLLIIAILSSMMGGVIITILHLRLLFTMDIEHALRMVIIDVLTILAVLEMFRTVLAYFSEGRVKVTYIIDTVLVVILTEVMAFWFKEIEYSKILMVIALVLSLIVARILAIRFSPARYPEDI